MPTGIMTGDMTGSARNKDFMETIRTRKRIKAGTKTGTTNRIKVTKKITSMATCVPAPMATNIMAGHQERLQWPLIWPRPASSSCTGSPYASKTKAYGASRYQRLP